MRILILDDVKNRHDVFDTVYKGHLVTHCYNYHEFITELNKCRYDIISLDHDLSDFYDHASTYVDGWGNTQFYNGAHAANQVCCLSVNNMPEKVIVHSVNPSGGRNMVNILTKAGINVELQPFSYPTNLFYPYP